MKPKTKKKVDSATAITTETCTTVAEKSTCSHNHFASMAKSPDWANPAAAGVQKAGADWDIAGKNLEDNATLITTLVAQLVKARAEQLILLRRWTGAKGGCLNAVNVFCDGSKDMVLGFGFGLLGHHVLPPALTPKNLRDKHSTVHAEAIVAWDPVPNNHNYMVQYATDPATPATYSAATPVSKTKFKVTGQVPGAIVHFRVLTIDPKLPMGQSAYTLWVPAIVGL